jgi:hypothetical protein
LGIKKHEVINKDEERLSLYGWIDREVAPVTVSVTFVGYGNLLIHRIRIMWLLEKTTNSRLGNSYYSSYIKKGREMI